jgi:hypothetical protein
MDGLRVTRYAPRRRQGSERSPISRREPPAGAARHPERVDRGRGKHVSVRDQCPHLNADYYLRVASRAHRHWSRFST